MKYNVIILSVQTILNCFMTTLSRCPSPELERLDAVLDLVQALDDNLCILDTETTGFSRSSGVVELAYVWFGVDGASEAFSCLLNPEMDIPDQAARVHGVYNEAVAKAPTYESVAHGVAYIFDNAALSGFNVRCYDVDVLRNTSLRYGVSLQSPNVFDVRDIWRGVHKTTKGNLAHVADHYGVTPGPAHQGMGDVITTARILEAMVRAHGIDVLLPYLQRNRTSPRPAHAQVMV